MSSPWKCPHCGTPQAEAARCWACKRSPLACSTCRDFRRSVAGKLGYCGKGKARAVLTGDEVRPCWSAPVTAEEPQLLGLFGSLEAPPTLPTPPAAPVARPRTGSARTAPPPTEAPTIGFAVTPDPADDDADRGVAEPEDPAPHPTPVRPVPRAPRGPAPTAAVAARRRWDAIVADVASGAPLGSEPTGGATPSMPYRPAPGTTPIVPWLATAARATDPTRPATATATVTPPLGTPSVAHPEPATPARTPTPATAVPSAVDEAAFAAWAASEPAAAAPASVTPPPALTPPTPAPWSSPIPGTSTWAQSTDDLTPSEPIRWRHRAVDDPAPAPATDPAGSSAALRRPTSLSLIPVTLANRLRRHLGTRGPRTDPAPAAPSGPSAPSALTSPSVRGATPISTTRSAPYGRLVDAPPVTGTIMSLGDQLRRAEQLRRERALLDGERLGGERRLEPPA